MRFSISIWAAALIAGVSASNVIDLSPDNWKSVVGAGKPGLVEFYATWCGHCKNLAPIYEELADVFSHAKDRVYVAKIDADGVGKAIGRDYDVKGFPTLKWFNADGTVEPYESGRDLDSLANFITTKSGIKSAIKPPPPSAVEILDVNTFDETVLNPASNVLVTFTAPWCGHCKNLKPVYEKVARDFASEPDCIVANIDADDQKNKDLARTYEVTSFPTIKFFSKDNKAGEDYELGRSEADFVSFLNEKCGTHRAIGGGLNEKAGRLVDFDALASRFFSATSDARAAVYQEAMTLGASAKEASKYYLRVMEKVVNGTEEYLEKESKRLEAILSKGNLAPSKLDELKIKTNILKAFKAEEEKEKVGRETAEL